MNILFVCIIKVVKNKENTVYTLQYRNGVERSKQSGAVGTKRWNILLAYMYTASTSAIYAEKQ